MKELLYNYLIDLPYLKLRLIDLADFALVSIMIWQFYKLFRNTVALRILLGLTGVIFLWYVVDKLDLKVSSAVLGQFISVGAIALLIVFQQEVRKFLLYVGRKYSPAEHSWIKRFLQKDKSHRVDPLTDPDILVKAVTSFSRNKTGALIVLGGMTDIQLKTLKGYEVDAILSLPLLEAIFNKTSSLHDGAVIIARGRIVLAAAVLPVSERTDLPFRIGLRHRAAMGITENTMATAISVSEETGAISLSRAGHIRQNINPDELLQMLME